MILPPGHPFGGLEAHGYRALMADPPWHFRAGINRRHPSTHYETMHLDDIKALPVADLAMKDCHMFLWTTPPHLQQSMTVMNCWGFRFVSIGFTWVKLRKAHRDCLFIDGDMFIGLGHTTRKSSEICLLGKRGKPTRNAKDIREVIFAARREHSRKPDEAFRRVTAYCDGPYLELFSREERAGWQTWGNQTGKFGEAA